MLKLIQKHGRIGLVLIAMSLNACATPQRINHPDYSKAFLAGVADEYESERYGPYTKEVVKDWMVLVGL